MMRDRLSGWFKRHHDLILILAPLIALLAVAIWLDAFETIHAFARSHEYLQVDEIFVALGGAAILYFAMLLRRTRRLRAELGLRASAEAAVARHDRYDSLTGLATRKALMAEIDREINRESSVTVFAIDLDRFKPINDSWGHQAGDTTLRAVADRLTALVGTHGTVGRLGGDEFACVLAHRPGQPDSASLAEEMLKAIARPIQISAGMAEISASIGIVECRERKCAAEMILSAADFAMSRAKQAGRSQFVVFAAEMEDAMRQRAQLEIDMRAGIHRGEIIPYFQPIVALKTGEVSGFECLARWQHPTRGLVPPDSFIPIAEEAGLIQELCIGLLRNACIAARAWPKQTTLSINISPLQLNDSLLPERILQILCTTGFAPGRLIVEVTESRLVGDIDNARTILESLKNAGVQIALDDFGTGYASLKHLRELHFNRIKIDRSFVQRLEEAENGQIVRAILRMCEGLRLPVVAEGIETAETAARLVALGCDFGQGFYYSPPVQPQEAAEIARRPAYPRADQRAHAYSHSPPKSRLRLAGATRAIN